MHAKQTGSSSPLPLASPPSNLEGLAAALAEQQWSGAAIKHHLPEILARADELAGGDRIDWLLGLREGWQRYGWAMNGREREQLFDLAQCWSDWPLLLAAAEGLEALRPLHPAERLGCCGALWHLGQTEEASILCRRLDWNEPGFAPAGALREALAAWQERLLDHPFAPVLEQTSGPLRLEPLGHHHLPDFAWQYFDPDIAELCCLPTFEGDDHWHRWIAENEALGDQLAFAVLHEDWGFIGSVNLIQHGGVGFVFYWLGADFRGYGLATQATELLLDMARQTTGLHACYAKVFEHNHASQRMLEKPGFERLEVRAQAPHDNEVFYGSARNLEGQPTANELNNFLTVMGSKVVLQLPVVFIDRYNHESRIVS